MPTKDSTAPTFQKKDDSRKVVIRSVKNTAIYKQEFEIEFLGQTKAWYERHSAQLLEVADVPEYLMKAEGWMTAEIDRCDRLMDKSTLDPLQLCLNQSLITDHLDIFRAQFEGLLANDKKDDLRRLYTLSLGTPDAELHFTTDLKKYISTYGVEKINGIADDAKDDPKMYLTSIIQIYNQFTSVVQTSFKNDKAYVEALDKAFQEIINANDRHGKKTHELVAKYADTILKKTNRIGDSCELDDNIESVKELNLEAIIVRIMKARKEMRHQQLVSDVVGVVKKRFKPEISHIKRSIDVLIEKGYIKRDANERDLYKYLA
uniref:Cullin_Nedd8 domain-containing protein n=1 Tax=Rhabditophanes sp. KR3021 TaxID=114890 RepID=A0AC35TVZ3_9BILA